MNKTNKRWNLRGAGIENLSLDETPIPAVAPDQLLVRHDACGICFSDVKIVNLGPDHPRLIGRDLSAEPVVMGHEVALTVIEVGGQLAGRFRVGQRFIVQADVYYRGVNLSYGYRLDGGMSQFGVIGREVLEGDEGVYLLPLRDSTGDVEAALVEPWACVVAAYRFEFRTAPKPGGSMLIAGCGAEVEMDAMEQLCEDAGSSRPGEIQAVGSGDLTTDLLSDQLFDDIIVIGKPSAADLEALAMRLQKGGVLNLAVGRMPSGPVRLDIGRVHYDQLLVVGGAGIGGLGGVLGCYRENLRSDLKPDGSVWFVGAGGPMGQMHVQRAIMAEQPPRRIVVTERHAERLERIRLRFGHEATRRGIELITLITEGSIRKHEFGAQMRDVGPFDDIVSLVPSAELVAETLPYLAEEGVYNLFAGVAKGVSAKVDLSAMLAKNQRLIGTSGSSVADLRLTLDLVESGKLSTNASLAAIGGMEAFAEGLAAVKAGRYPGKIVIFPQLAKLPLTALEDLKDWMPPVFSKLEDGKFWTKAAEEELFAQMSNEQP